MKLSESCVKKIKHAKPAMVSVKKIEKGHYIRVLENGKVAKILKTKKGWSLYYGRRSKPIETFRTLEDCRCFLWAMNLDKYVKYCL